MKLNNDLIEYAKELVEREYDGSKPDKRKWFQTTVTPHSYDDSQYEVQVFVREGSPPKGFVLATKDFVMAVGCCGTPVKYLNAYDLRVLDRAEKARVKRERARRSPAFQVSA